MKFDWAAARAWLDCFRPAPMAIRRGEQLRGAAGALVGLLATALIVRLTQGASVPILIAPLGASAVLLFAVPASPLAQPWSIVGGNFVAAVIGVTLARYVPNPAIAAPLAVALAILVTLNLRCLHPPSGAVALTTVLGGPAVTAAGYHFVLTPVMLDSALLMFLAVVYNNLTGRVYPHDFSETASLLPVIPDPEPQDQVLDIAYDAKERQFQSARSNIRRRRFVLITCADVMTRDVVAVSADAPLHEAWSILREHGVRSMPVIDADRRVIGMVSDRDLLGSVVGDLYWDATPGSAPPVHPSESGRSKLVGQIMRSGVQTVSETMHAVDLVRLMAGGGPRHVAVVDGERRLSGIISQTDLVAVLYRSGWPARTPATANATTPRSLGPV